MNPFFLYKIYEDSIVKSETIEIPRGYTFISYRCFSCFLKK